MTLYSLRPGSDTIRLSAADATRGPDECRQAALGFVRGAADWDKRELAEWLTGPYRNATRHVWTGERTVCLGRAAATLTPTVARSIAVVARRIVLASIALAVHGGMRPVAEAAIDRGQIRAAASPLGGCWAAVDVRANLAERVLSHFVIDYRSRPIDYRDALFVCAECETVTFDPSARQHGCPLHRRESGIAFAPASWHLFAKTP